MKIKGKWLAYVFIVGLIPILARLLAWAVTTVGSVQPFAAIDFVAFGLVLHISVVNEIEHRTTKDKEWKSVQNATSLVFIALYSVLYAVSIIGENRPDVVDQVFITVCGVCLAVVSSLLCLTVFHRIARSA